MAYTPITVTICINKSSENGAIYLIEHVHRPFQLFDRPTYDQRASRPISNQVSLWQIPNAPPKNKTKGIRS